MNIKLFKHKCTSPCTNMEFMAKILEIAGAWFAILGRFRNIRGAN